jgi:hypothetical protein
LDRPNTTKSNDKKRKLDCFVVSVEWSRHNNTEYQPRLGEFERFMDRICIFHPEGKHNTWACDRLQVFADEVLKSTKKFDQDKKPKHPKGDFPEAHMVVNYIYGGPDSYESKRKQKLIARDVMVVSPATPESGLRFPSPLIQATTRTSSQSHVGTN